MKKLLRDSPLLYAVSGFLCAFPIVFTSLPILGWLAFAPAAYLLLDTDAALTRKSFRTAYRNGFCFFEAFGLVIFYWFCMLYPLDFIDGMSKGGAVAVVISGWIGLSLLQSVVAALQFVVFTAVKAAAEKKGLRAEILSVILLPSLYIVFEWVQTQTWMGVPWAKLALGQVKLLPVIQSASLLGSYFVDFLLILTGTLAAAVLIKLKQKKYRQTSAYLIIAAVVFSANLTFGCVKIACDKEDAGAEPVTVALLQGNISSADKWETSKLNAIMEVYSSLAKDASKTADLVVWPETAIPYTVTVYADLREQASALVAECDTQMLIGAFTQSDAVSDKTNAFDSYTSTMFYNSDGTYTGENYSKRHLVPFGEYLPWAGFFETVYPPLANLTMFENPLSPGTQSSVFNTDAGKVGSLICFDSIYETLAIDSVRDGAEILAISTNDSWFSDSSAVWQHNNHAVLRAVENDRYVVRAANTGVSSSITPTGEVTALLEPLVRGYVETEVYPRSELTLYTRIGNLFVVLCASYTVITAAAVILKRKRT